MESKIVHCELAGRCSGCGWIQQDYSSQLLQKRQQMLKALKGLGVSFSSVEVHHRGTRAGRSRLDLTLENIDGQMRLGLYSHEDRAIVDMLDCPMATPELNDWLKEFRKLPLPPIKNGSLRLRVSPSGERGVWIDFSNQDIKTLLDDGGWLRRLKELAVVEIGQKNKRLIEKDGRLKLGEPELSDWFETYAFDKAPLKIYLPIAGFTQTGFLANQLLVEKTLRRLREIGTERVLELFCGSGNFTLALASEKITVKAIELDALALEGLSRSLKESALEDYVQVLRKDLYRVSSEELKAPVWMVDPPRSGLKGVVDRIAELSVKDRPEHILYISCFLESWTQDAEKLLGLGYRLNSVEGVDQFPNTPHCEWISVFSRSISE